LGWELPIIIFYLTVIILSLQVARPRCIFALEQAQQYGVPLVILGATTHQTFETPLQHQRTILAIHNWYCRQLWLVMTLLIRLTVCLLIFGVLTMLQLLVLLGKDHISIPLLIIQIFHKEVGSGMLELQ